MTLMDAASATAFALRSSPSSGSGTSGVLQQQRGVRSQTSAVTRLGSIDPAPASRSRSGSQEQTATSGLTPPPLRPRNPLFSFGAIADVQYADQDDGWNFEKDFRRYYRGGLLKLRDAVDVWLKDETHRFD